MTDEELVRKVWRGVHIYSSHQYQKDTEPLYWSAALAEGELLSGYDTREQCILNAAAYTRAHLEKVQQKREEVYILAALVRDSKAFSRNKNFTQQHRDDCKHEFTVFTRILSMLEVQLTELESGLTDWAKEHVEGLMKEG